jgi:3-deoxy-manno-octulosonate cytidylyltransferase (CMP-KDO synthetase)
MAALKHLGIYAYQVRLLNEFITWAPTILEQTEKLEQLRAMWHGVKIFIGISAVPIPAGVDTEQDLQRAIEFIRTSEKT